MQLLDLEPPSAPPPPVSVEASLMPVDEHGDALEYPDFVRYMAEREQDREHDASGDERALAMAKALRRPRYAGQTPHRPSGTDDFFVLPQRD